MRASTEPYALLCATAIRERLGATWGLGETGATGPRQPLRRRGRSQLHRGVGSARRSITLETGQSDREGNMWRFARASLDLFEQVLRSG